MSLYSMFGLVALASALSMGIILKLAMRQWRKKIDGVQGYLEQEKCALHCPTDDWELL